MPRPKHQRALCTCWRCRPAFAVPQEAPQPPQALLIWADGFLVPTCSWPTGLHNLDAAFAEGCAGLLACKVPCDVQPGSVDALRQLLHAQQQQQQPVTSKPGSSKAALR